MAKKHLWKILLSAAVLVIAVVWALGIVGQTVSALAPLSAFTSLYALMCLTGVVGIALLLKGIFGKNVTYLKKLNVFVGCALIGVAVISLVLEFVTEAGNLVAPIIIVIVALAIFLSYLVVGGKKWDTGDNQKKGYKNYYERKAEEDAKKKSDDAWGDKD